MIVQRTSTATTVIIPSVSRLSDILITAIWCTLWPIGFLLIPHLQILPRYIAVDITIKLIIFFAWVAVWVTVLWKIVYWLFGKEVIQIEVETIKYSRKAIGIGRHRTIAVADIKKIRLSPRKEWVKDWQWPLHATFHEGGAVSLYIGSRVIRIGRNLTDEQAIEFIEILPDKEDTPDLKAVRCSPTPLGGR